LSRGSDRDYANLHLVTGNVFGQHEAALGEGLAGFDINDGGA